MEEYYLKKKMHDPYFIVNETTDLVEKSEIFMFTLDLPLCNKIARNIYIILYFTAQIFRYKVKRTKIE